MYNTYAEFYITSYANYSVRHPSNVTFHTNQVLHPFYTLCGKGEAAGYCASHKNWTLMHQHPIQNLCFIGSESGACR